MAIVLKFGGTSMGSAKSLKLVAKIIQHCIKQKPVVVVSAVSGITDLLLEAIHKKQAVPLIKQKHKKILKALQLSDTLLDKEFNKLSELLTAIHALRRAKSKVANSVKLSDNIVSFGERMSSKILAAYLQKQGIPAQTFASWQLGLITDSTFGDAKPKQSCFPIIKRKIAKLSVVPVITGYIARDSNKEITTFGRGGSDYSASIFAYAINAKALEIWTDVSGIYSTDPKIVKTAKPIKAIGFDEVAELSYFGARVLHPKTIILPLKKRIPVKILNTFKPSAPGTAIVANTNVKNHKVKALSLKQNMVLINLYSAEMIDQPGFMADLFTVFKNEQISVDVVTTTTATVTVVVDKPGKQALTQAIKQLGKKFNVTIEHKLSALCVVGHGLTDPGKILTILSKKKIHPKVISVGSTKLNVTMVLDEKDAVKALKLLHKKLIH